MKQRKEEAYELIKDRSVDYLISSNKNAAQEFILEVNKESGVPMSTISDYMNGRILEDNTNEYCLFVLMKHLCNQKLKDYFTDQEISGYSKAKYETDKIKYPIRIPCLQVNPDQWIGVTDVNFIVSLVNEQKIRYNANAQRVMTRVIKGTNEYYTITQNKQAIREIVELYDTGAYIPDALTFNFADDADNDFHYDSERKEMIISSLDYLDITDGYHRYRAMCEEKNKNPNFNYPVIIQFVAFSDDKSKQMIFQVDQKTQMKKVDSDSMNMNDPANIVLERLNNDILFFLKGEISRNEGMVNFSRFSEAIRTYYFNEKRKYNSKEIINVQIILRNKLNYIYSTCPNFFNSEDDIYVYMGIIRLTLDDINLKEFDERRLSRYLDVIYDTGYRRRLLGSLQAKSAHKRMLNEILERI